MTGHTKGAMHLSGARHKIGSANFHTLLIYDEKAKRDEVVAEVYFCERTGLGLADGQRLAACWNALATIPDPAAFMEAARGMREALLPISQKLFDPAGIGRTDCTREEINAARDALATFDATLGEQ